MFKNNFTSFHIEENYQKKEEQKIIRRFIYNTPKLKDSKVPSVVTWGKEKYSNPRT